MILLIIVSSQCASTDNRFRPIRRSQIDWDGISDFVIVHSSGKALLSSGDSDSELLDYNPVIDTVQIRPVS